MIQRSRGYGTLRVLREHGARGEVLYWCTLFFVPWTKKVPNSKTLSNHRMAYFWDQMALFSWYWSGLQEKIVPKTKKERSSVQNLPPSSMFPRHPKGAISTASLDHPMYVVNRETSLDSNPKSTQIFIKYMHDIVLEISFLDINSQNCINGSCLKLWQVIVKIQQDDHISVNK